MSMGTLMVLESAQMRRRRDSRGRYMEGEESPNMRMEYGGERSARDRRSEMTMGRYSMEEPDMRRSANYSRESNDMRMPGVYPSETRREDRRRSMEERPGMKGEGHFVWDDMDRAAEAHDPGYWRHGTEDNITDMREYGRRYSPQSHMEEMPMNHRQMTQQRQIGFQQREMEREIKGKEHLTPHQSEAWVRGMKDGGKWKNVEDVKMLAQRLGIVGEDEIMEFWALLNATYGDICKVAKKYNVDRPDFYADMAKALFLEDEDAVEGKPVLYYEYLVKKDKE